MNKAKWTLQCVSPDGGEDNTVETLASFTLLPTLEQVQEALQASDAQLDITLEQYAIIMDGGMTTIAPHLCAYQMTWSQR